MRGWGFTKKLEPIVWLGALLGRGRCGRQSHRCSAQPPRGEGELARTWKGKDEGAPGHPRHPPAPREDSGRASSLCSTQLAALLCSALLCSALLSLQLVRQLPAPTPCRPSHLAQQPLGSRHTCAGLDLAAVNFAGLPHLHHPVNHSEASPSQQPGRAAVTRPVELFCSGQVQPPQEWFSRPYSAMKLLHLPYCRQPVP